MATRKLVKVTLIDNDPALDVSMSVVASIDNIVTEDDTNTLIQEVLMNPEYDISGKIEEHNNVRGNELDLQILKNTGNEVMLQSIKLKNLTWIVS